MLRLAAVAATIMAAEAFMMNPSCMLPSKAHAVARSSCQRIPLRKTNLRMGIEQLEFIIHPDGRVEEKVTGVKGRECLKITEEIEESLGKVVHTESTPEMFEEKVVIQNVENVKEGTGSWNGGGEANQGSWTQY
ncbi:hypothetical protein GUITHDRAFT_150404 [Guillardia theta CCMP2712]|uniref:DUF2997 domain-containing protein n=1 Tax=Guillardia theta (strain CCMP2712) TaxID=905079 RepID=L1JZ88_GUITC|nr:hypothetical protein GUITHDRAFT_150404 [Guillardia theta CCMP2712]EKX53413.1 hypothetical protein GUITHDRAFT_150404 [Guillardia theta CCMP2712]|eukprot:XP_005840393.1 hypothetical protein GUITHDRAFT_150404 [Guillardia theta CCMP2712]